MDRLLIIQLQRPFYPQRLTFHINSVELFTFANIFFQETRKYDSSSFENLFRSYILERMRRLVFVERLR